MIFHVCAKRSLGPFWESFLEAFGMPLRPKCGQKLSKGRLQKNVENRNPGMFKKVTKRTPKSYLKSGNFSPGPPQCVHRDVPRGHGCLRGWIWRRKYSLGSHFLCPFAAGNRSKSISRTTIFPSGALEFEFESNVIFRFIFPRCP